MTRGWTVGVNGLKMRAALYDSKLNGLKMRAALYDS